MKYRLMRKVVVGMAVCIGFLQVISIVGAQALSAGIASRVMPENSGLILKNSFDQSVRLQSPGKAAVLFRHSGTGFLESAGFDTELISISTEGTSLIQEVSILREYNGTSAVEGSFVFETIDGKVACKKVLPGNASVQSWIEHLKNGRIALVQDSGFRTEYWCTQDDVVVKTQSSTNQYSMKNLVNPESSSTVHPVPENLGSGEQPDEFPVIRNIFEKTADCSWSVVEPVLDDPEMAMALHTCLESRGMTVLITMQNLAPVADIFVSGMARLFNGPDGLENMARLEAVLGPDRNMRAVLAWFLLAGKGGK